MADVVDAITAREGFAVMRIEEVYDFLGLEGAARVPSALAGCPSFVLGNGEPRWLREQVITWAALGGAAPRPKSGRPRALHVREDA